MRRFHQEALAASSLNHPNIITIHEVGQSDSGGFMATEFIEGPTLRRLVEGGRCPFPSRSTSPSRSRAPSRPRTAPASSTATSSPRTSWCARDGLVKVLDFGIAKYSEAGRGERTARAALVQTKTGAVVGTTAYMSPEQARGLPTDAHRRLVLRLRALRDAGGPAGVRPRHAVRTRSPPSSSTSRIGPCCRKRCRPAFGGCFGDA